MISTKLDLDYEQAEPSCRILFCGNVVHIFRDADEHKCLKLSRVRLQFSCEQDQEMPLLAVEVMHRRRQALLLWYLRNVLLHHAGRSMMAVCCISNSRCCIAPRNVADCI